MEPKEIINRMKKLMKIELEQMSLDNGTVLEADVFESGAAIFVVSGEDRIPVPVGTYMLEGGESLVVVEEGVIDSIGVMEETVEEEQEMQEEVKPRKVVESVVSETHFSKETTEEIEEEEVVLSDQYKTAIREIVREELSKLGKEEKTALKKVEPINHSPEKNQSKKFVFSSAGNTKKERITSFLNNK